MGPLRSNFGELFENKLVFLTGPVSSDNTWVQNIVPSLTALSTQSAGKIPSNDNPVLSSQLVYFAFKYSIFLRGPLAALILNWNRRLSNLDLLFFKIQFVQNVHSLKNIPSFEAPYLSLIGHVLA